MSSKFRFPVRARLLVLLGFGAWAPCAAAQYQATTLYKVSAPVGINLSAAYDVAEGQTVGTGVASVGNEDHALYWNPSGLGIDLHPSGFTKSIGTAASGNVQVGYGTKTGTSHSDALMWTGTPGSVIDLTPAGDTNSLANGTDGTYEVGEGQQSGGTSHALMWAGSNVAVDLHPAAYDTSLAFAVKDGRQVGTASIAGAQHAMLWTGTAASAVDLHPSTGFINTFARGTGGSQQVGDGYGPATGGNTIDSDNALLWTGAAASLINLNPAGYQLSEAIDTNGVTEVGFANVTVTSAPDAVAWNGTASSYVNLQSFLPSDLTSSIAFTVDASGNIFGAAFDTNNGTYAIEWSPVPEPSAAMFLSMLGVSLLRRRCDSSATSKRSCS